MRDSDKPSGDLKPAAEYARKILNRLKKHEIRNALNQVGIDPGTTGEAIKNKREFVYQVVAKKLVRSQTRIIAPSTLLPIRAHCSIFELRFETRFFSVCFLFWGGFHSPP
jgi:hypothetical protein